tara:strand:+ start:1525 stop:1743 length:219 start_codon:yes stop_codon:yes gene_type:complete
MKSIKKFPKEYEQLKLIFEKMKAELKSKLKTLHPDDTELDGIWDELESIWGQVIDLELQYGFTKDISIQDLK